jgi:hypothetical protein
MLTETRDRPMSMGAAPFRIVESEPNPMELLQNYPY